MKNLDVLLKENGLTAFQSQFEDICSPCVGAQVNEEIPGVGESKVGGKPDVPDGFIWPMYDGYPLEFLCQLNCQELESDLYPPCGIVYFFYRDNSFMTKYEEKGKVRVFFESDLKSLSPMDPPRVKRKKLFGLMNPTVSPKTYKQAKLSFSPSVSLPESEYLSDSFSDQMEELDEFESYYNVKEELVNSRFIQIGGYANPVQGGGIAESIAHLSKIGSAAEWKMILEVSSFPELDMMWGDVGRIHVFTHSRDIDNRSYENTWLEYQCH